MPSTRRLATLAALAAFGLLLGTADLSAQGTVVERNEDITNTKHNFSLSSGRSSVPGAATLPGDFADYGEICVYCHTPHGGGATAPLWNRTMPSATYIMYNDPSNTSQSELDMTFAATPNPVSAACLSCHEGTIGVDVIINAPNASTATPGAATSLGDMFTTSPDNLKVLGSDLRDDHPISMVYDPADDDQFKDISTSVLKLFGGGVGTGTVECATCHNPHTLNATFLRIQNGASALCLTCHTK
jgi:predicted CXXCH cytochrome family protein